MGRKCMFYIKMQMPKLGISNSHKTVLSDVQTCPWMTANLKTNLLSYADWLLFCNHATLLMCKTEMRELRCYCKIPP